ncbi:MAG: metallophosphoesterase [Thermostichales cyanobacterium BF4_bins_65]
MALLAHITDTHLLGDPEGLLRGINPYSNLQRVLEHVKQYQPDLYLFTGDIAETGEAPAYELFASLTAGLGKCMLPGNHDHPHWFGDPQVYELGGWRLLLLSSVLATSRYGEGQLSPGSLAWLGQRLGESRQPTLIALHHPPVAVGVDWLDQMGLVNSEAFWQVVTPQVKLVVFGHIHHAFATVYGGIPCYGTPSSHSQIREPRDPGYRLIWLGAGGEYRTQVIWVRG